MTSAKVYAAVPNDANDVCPIKVGQVVADIALRDINGKDVQLHQQLKKGNTLLVLYRGSWCPYCNTHLGELAKVESDLQKLGYQILAISPDRPENLKRSVEKKGLGYTLLSDSKAELATSLGLAFKVDDKMYKMLQGYDIHLEKASGENHRILPVPAALLINKKGEVEFIYASPNYKTRIDADLLLAAAKSVK